MHVKPTLASCLLRHTLTQTHTHTSVYVFFLCSTVYVCVCGWKSFLSDFSTLSHFMWHQNTDYGNISVLKFYICKCGKHDNHQSRLEHSETLIWQLNQKQRTGIWLKFPPGKQLKMVAFVLRICSPSKDTKWDSYYLNVLSACCKQTVALSVCVDEGIEFRLTHPPPPALLTPLQKWLSVPNWTLMKYKKHRSSFWLETWELWCPELSVFDKSHNEFITNCNTNCGFVTNKAAMKRLA